MNRSEYITILESKLELVLQNKRFINYKNQLSARKLSAQFLKTYTEEYLWNRALFLSSNGALLLLYGNNERLAIGALKESANIYENLFKLSEQYDNAYALILSALCYDIAGYQANALCLMKEIESYELTTIIDGIDLQPENYILEHLRLILLKNIPKSYNHIKNSLNSNLGIALFNESLSRWYEQILRGVENNYLVSLDDTYKHFLNTSNIPISQLIFLLKTRVTLYVERSIWENLKKIGLIEYNDVWRKYIKLLTNDIYNGRSIKSLDRRVSKFELWTSQLRAIQKGVVGSDASFVLQMPTSAGKTFIAELTILDSLLRYPNKKCLYISPFRALTTEKEADLSENLSKLGFSVSALSGSYEVDEFQDIILSDTDVLIATPEKIDLLFRLNPDYFNQISLAVVDEGHILGDISPRSSLLEFLIIRLKLKANNIKILFISAVMPAPNADQYSMWLSGTDQNVIRSKMFPDSDNTEEWEPTRKLIGSFTWEGSNGKISYKNMSTEDELTNVVTESFVPFFITKKQYGKQFPNGSNKAQTSAALGYRFTFEGNTLIFCAQARETERLGLALLNLIDGVIDNEEELPLWFKINRDTESYYYASKWYSDDSTILKCLSRGIGIHFGDLPEPVRRSVEEDFARGNLKILISTNTIGQGLNFPIKNLIFHSTIISGGENMITIEVRDFWNIVGRAGRAGMETEGQVIFNINSPTDKRSFNKYVNKDNIDDANSLFFNVLNLLVEQRITRKIFEKNIEILAEPYLLDLITEESLETDDEEIISSIIENSLFSIQSYSKGIDMKPIRKSFKRIFSTIKTTNSIQEIKVFSETGLSLDSNYKIYDFINFKVEALNIILESDDYLELLKTIYDFFDAEVINEMDSYKLNSIGIEYYKLLPITILWLKGVEVNTLQQEWRKISANISHLNTLISDGFYYRIPWLISSFITIMLHLLNKERDSLPEGIGNMVSFIKYGLNNPTACILKSLGIRSRNVALEIAVESGNLEGNNLIKWLSNLDSSDVDMFKNMSQYDKKNILDVAGKLTPKNLRTLPDKIYFFLKGISNNEEMISTSNIVSIGDYLNYERELNNVYDPFAIRVMLGELSLGYIPREYAKLLSVEIDIDEKYFTILVSEIIENNDYKEIAVIVEREDLL